MKIASTTCNSNDSVILSEAKNLGSEMFRFAQHDNAIARLTSCHAS